MLLLDVIMEYELVIVYVLLLLYGRINVFVVIHSIFYYPFFFIDELIVRIGDCFFYRSYKYKIYII